MLKVLTHSSNGTKRFAKVFAKKILARSFDFSSCLPASRAASIIGLTGDLGSGKTTFIQGFLKGLGVKQRITSPTFVIFKRYEIPACRQARKDKNYKNVYHVDCYRLNKPEEILKLGFKEIINNPQNIVLIEWAEKLKKILPKKIDWINFEYGKKYNERKITTKL